MKSDAKITTVNMPSDVREILQAWAKHHMTSMSSEIARTVRERAQRERQEAAAA